MDTETGNLDGQPGEGTATEQTTGTGTENFDGQSGAGEQTTGAVGGEGTGQQAATNYETTFFDPNDLDPALMPAYKNMQAAFSKKTAQYAADRHKVEAYDSFSQNPVGTLQALAQQYGFQLIQPGQQPQQAGGQDEWMPQTWDEVMSKAKEQATQEVLSQLQPLIGQVQQMRQSNVETFLDNTYPDWRQYEDQMSAILKNHPTLANDPGTLYKMAVPDEVIKSRATKAALEKIQANSANAQLSGQSTSHKPAPQRPAGPLTFNQAVEVAKQRIAQGLGVSR